MKIKSKEDFEKLLHKSKYQVFILSSPISYPLNYGIHCWFIINLKGSVERWEVFGAFAGEKSQFKSGLCKNTLKPQQGLNQLFYKGVQSETKFRFNSKLLFSIEGDENSTAHAFAKFISSNSHNYPKINEYKLLSPNSNTYIQWVLNQFPQISFKLPRRAIGKNYAIKKL